MINISIKTAGSQPDPHPRRHEARIHGMKKEEIIGHLTTLNIMNKGINTGVGDLIESPDKLREKTIEELRELYIEITGKLF